MFFFAMWNNYHCLDTYSNCAFNLFILRDVHCKINSKYWTCVFLPHLYCSKSNSTADWATLVGFKRGFLADGEEPLSRVGSSSSSWTGIIQRVETWQLWGSDLPQHDGPETQVAAFKDVYFLRGQCYINGWVFSRSNVRAAYSVNIVSPPKISLRNLWPMVPVNLPSYCYWPDPILLDNAQNQMAMYI